MEQLWEPVDVTMQIRVSALRFWSLNGNFFQNPTWTFHNKSYFHLRSPLHGGGEGTPFLVCYPGVQSSRAASFYGMREKPLDDIWDFFFVRLEQCCLTPFPCSSTAMTGKDIFPIYLPLGGLHSPLHCSATTAGLAVKTARCGRNMVFPICLDNRIEQNRINFIIP